MKRRMIDWDRVVRIAGRVPVRAIQKALEAVQRLEAVQGAVQDGQATLEYVAVIALIAIIFFLAATWVKDAGVLEQVRAMLQAIP
jgi:hypothetical protein